MRQHDLVREDAQVMAFLRHRADDVPLSLPWLETREPRPVNPIYPALDRALSFRVTERWAAEAQRQLRLLGQSGVAMQSFMGRVNDPEKQYAGKIGEIAVAQYLRWHGCEVDEPQRWRADNPPAGYDPIRCRYDLVAQGHPIEVKTCRRTVRVDGDAPEFVAHLNRAEGDPPAHGEQFVFCSLYEDTEIGDEVLQILGFLDGPGLLHAGAFVRKGECIPGDPYPQRASNWAVRVAHLWPIALFPSGH